MGGLEFNNSMKLLPSSFFADDFMLDFQSSHYLLVPAVLLPC